MQVGSRLFEVGEGLLLETTGGTGVVEVALDGYWEFGPVSISLSRFGTSEGQEAAGCEASS